MLDRTPDHSNDGPNAQPEDQHPHHPFIATCPCEDCQPDHIVESTIAFRETDHFDEPAELEPAELECDEVVHFSHMMDRLCDEE